MAPDPSGRLGLPLPLPLPPPLLLLLPPLLLLLPPLPGCLAAGPVELLEWLWFSDTYRPVTPRVSVAPGSPPVPPTEDTTTQAAPRDGPTEQGAAAPAGPELPPGSLGAGRPGASATQPPSLTSPDTKGVVNVSEATAENITGVGAMILNVAMGIRSFIQLWGNITSAENATGTELPALAAPAGPLAFPGPSGAPQEGGTTPWPAGGALSSPDATMTEAGSPPVPTRPLPSPDGPRALLGEPSVPRKSPGREPSPPCGAGPLPGEAGSPQLGPRIPTAKDPRPPPSSARHFRSPR